RRPPILVWPGAVALQSALRLPNLFVPHGTRLHPLLRRDVLRRRLAADESLLTWLSPGAGGAPRLFRLPFAAFRPLEDVIEYCVEQPARALPAWSAVPRVY